MTFSLSTLERDENLRDGCRLQAEGRWQEAAECFEEAVRVAPHDLQALVQLGFVQILLKEWLRAAETHERIVPLLPRDYRVWSNLSHLYEQSGNFAAAEDRARKALRLAPDCAEAWNNLGMALRGQHNLPEAVHAFQQALTRQPHFPLAEFNLATTQLLKGDYASGWPGYEFRNRLPEASLRTAKAVRWQGEPLTGGTLLVYSDQGCGDLLQFVRFVPAVRRRAEVSRLILSVPRELVRLVEKSGLADQVISLEDEPGAVTAEIAVGSLPGILRIEHEELATGSAYLASDGELPATVTEVFREVPGGMLRVGVVWQGNPQQARDAERSIPLERLAPLADVSQIAWCSLQVDPVGRKQWEQFTGHWRLFDLGGRVADFAETAAVLRRLDLVITVDTALAHLAGALGHPVWTMLCHTPDWRWGLNGDRCPWYPTMRLFRQPRWGDWDSVISQVKAALLTYRDLPRSSRV